MDNENRIALFVDLDNFVGFCLDDELPLDIQGEISKLSELGRISIRRSFGDIVKLPMQGDKKYELRQMLQANLIQHEDIPHYNKYKNTADIRLAIEALSIAYTYPDINIFAVIANDRDFMPLFSKLKEIGKTVIGIGSTPETVGQLYKSACDTFFYHDELSDAGGSVSRKSAPQAMPSDENQVVDLLLDVARQFFEKGKKTLGSTLVPAMKKAHPNLDFQQYSFKNFRGLCELAENKGFITVASTNGDNQGGDILIELNEAKTKEHLHGDGAFYPYEVSNLITQYQDFVRDSLKLRAPLPDYSARKAIYTTADELLAEAEDGLSLRDLSNQITERLGFSYDEQAGVFKILYTLYRSECFYALRTEDSYNPVIKNSILDHDEMDQSLVKRLIALFRKNARDLEFNPNVWSEYFIGNTAYARVIRFVYTYE